MKYVLVILLQLILITHSIAQSQPDNTEDVITDQVENNAEDISESVQTELPEELIELSKNKVDLNSDEINTLVRYHLISEQQQNALLNYRKTEGDLIAIEELQQISEFDHETLENLRAYCTVRKIKNIPLTHQVTIRYQQSLSQQQNYYEGSSAKILLKIKSILSQKIRLSYLGEKDPGEKIFTSKTPAFDFNSFTISYSGNSSIKKILVGDFNIEFGQGLNVWTGLSFSGGAAVSSIYKSGRRVLPYTGTDENRFFRGIAIEINKSKFINNIWFSNHTLDGNLNIDSVTQQKYVTSFQNTGYHRSQSELYDKHSLTETAIGFSSAFKNKNFEIGIIANALRYSLPLEPELNSYNKYKFRGNKNTNVGNYYNFNYKNILLFGEMSAENKNKLAIIDGAIINISPALSTGLLFRNYPEEFVDLKSSAIGINTDNTNERGTLFSINYKLSKTLLFSGYFDKATFGYLKYKVSTPSEAINIFTQLDFTPNKKTTLQFRHSIKYRQSDNASTDEQMLLTSQQVIKSYRFSSRFKFDNGLEYGMRCEYTFQESGQIKSPGSTMLSQDIFYNPLGKKYSANVRYSVFNCPVFETRIYSYENDVLGAFSIPFYYGRGTRYYFNIAYSPGRRINISLRYSESRVKDTEQKINKSSEIKVQLKYSIS